MSIFFHSMPSWIQLVSMAFCAGTLVCLLWVLPLSIDTDNYLLTRMWFFFGICIFAIIAGSAADLLLRAAEMSGKPLQTVFPVLPTILLKTHFGRVWLIRIVSLLLLGAVFSTGKQRRNSRAFLFITLGIGVIISMTESASGHASDAGDFSIAEIIDWLHLLAALVWGGGLFVLSAVIMPVITQKGEQGAVRISGAAHRFSQIAGIAVGVVLLTAIYNTWFYVGSVKALLTSPYGQIVVVKIILFLVLLNLGAFNRYITVPLLLEWGGSPVENRGMINTIAAHIRTRFRSAQNGHQIALWFRRSVRVEAILIIGVLLCVALLQHKVPGRHFMHIKHGVSMGHHPGIE